MAEKPDISKDATSPQMSYKIDCLVSNMKCNSLIKFI